MLSKSGDHHTVPLSVLLKRESDNEKVERPELSHGQASQSKKGEDLTFVKNECRRVLSDGVTTFSVYALMATMDPAAAIYTKENLLSNVLSVIPADLTRDEWVSALPRALVAGFVKTDKKISRKEIDSYLFFIMKHVSKFIRTLVYRLSMIFGPAKKGDIVCIVFGQRFIL